MNSNCMDKIASKLPQAWQGLLAVLNCHGTAQEAAHWLVENEQKGHLSWPWLLAALSADKSQEVDLSGSLIFMPRMCLLAPQLQCRLLAFFLDNREKVPSCSLQQFLDKITSHNGWTSTLLKLLSDGGHSPDMPYEFSHQNIDRAMRFKDMAQGVTSSSDAQRTIPVDYTLPNAMEYIQKEVFEVNYSNMDMNKAQDTDQDKDAGALDEKGEVGMMKLKEALYSGIDCRDEETRGALVRILEHKPASLISELDLEHLEELSVLQFSQLLCDLSDSIISGKTASLIQALLLNRLVNLEQKSSRMLLSAASMLAACFPEELLEAVLVPLACHYNIGLSQTDFLLKVVEGCYGEQHYLNFIRQVVQVPKEVSIGAIQVLEKLLEKKLPISREDLSLLIESMEKSAVHMAKNPKYGKLILTLVNNYSPKITRRHISSLQSCINMHETVMSKPALAALQRIEAKGEG